MAYIKKIWVDVPDPNNPPSIPEGQDALARFDAENMNRIEDGIADHTHNYAGSSKAGGEAYAAWRLPYVPIGSSSTLHRGKWKKFAIIDCTADAWLYSGVKLSFQDAESGMISGILNVHVKTLANIASQDVKLTWDTINNQTYADCVAIVKERDGLFGLYFHAPDSYCTMSISLLTTTHNRISFVYNSEWISEIEPLKLSQYTPLYSYSQTDLIAGTSPLETGKLYFVYE